MTPITWILAGVLLLVAGYVLYSKASVRRWEKSRKPQPLWKDQYLFRGALISPTRTIYSTHIRKGTGLKSGGAPVLVYFGDVDYLTSRFEVLNDEAAWVSALMATDVSAITHDPVVGVTPVRIADRVREGERAIAYLRNEVVECVVTHVGASIKVSARGATYGDSSSPVVNARGELITLLSMAGGLGPNLTRIKPLLLGEGKS